MCDCLEFAEHRLSEQRRAEHIEIVRKQVFSKLARSGFEQVLQEQHFVDSRCDFRNENFVIRFSFRKRGVAVIRVHGVSEFVRNGKHVVNGFLVIEENKRVYAVHAPRIGTASLAFVLERINPTALECGRQNVGIFLTHNFKCLFDEFNCVFVFERKFLLFDHRHVKVVHIECVYAQNFLA